MTQYLPIILASGLLAFVATPLTRLLAQRWGMIDQPGLRKAHRSPVPLLGGLAIYSALIAALLVAFNLFGSQDWLTEGLGILGGATLLFFTGLWDDRFGMRARIKLLAQAVAAGCLMAAGVQVHLFGAAWLDWLITFMWIVGITNAANLMDNMDGLAAGVAAVAALSFFMLAALEGQGLVASLAAALGGAAAGFLFYNFAPAISFMGDAGSLTLGFMLAVLGIKIKFINHPLGATWMAPIVVLGVLIFDTTLVSISRIRRGRSIFQGGSDHTSHRLVQLGLSHSRAVLTLYVATAALGALALYLTRATVLMANFAFGALVVVGLLTLIIFERIEPKLSGDPPLVLIPGGGGSADLLRAVLPISQELTILFAPRHLGAQIVPARQEVIETLVLLAEDALATRGLLERGLSEEWWCDLNRLNRTLQLKGLVLAVADTPLVDLPDPAAPPTPAATVQPDALTAIRKAKVIVFGPGDPASNLLSVLAAPGVRENVQQAHGLRVRAQSGAEKSFPLGAWLGQEPLPVALASLSAEIQAQLLAEAAGHAKTQT
jgi:UDP-GlcNAc:undecaprenyl-phosphate GlcNAc-1-phosphate transferase